MTILANLINKIEKFYIASAHTYLNLKYAQMGGYTMPDDEDDDLPRPGSNGDLLSKADEYDIKDELLFDQFEKFINAYRELVATLGVDPKYLKPEALQDAVGLIDNLKQRYDRIMNNPKLDDPNFSEEEDFDPGEFSKFVSDVVDDAERQLKAIAGEDVDELKETSNEYVAQFKQLQDKAEEGKQEEWSAKQQYNRLMARKRWFEELMADKKLNINNPRYQRYIASRRQSYQRTMDRIKSDPEAYAEYKKKLKERQVKFHTKLQKQKAELTAQLAKTTDPRKKAELEAELYDVSAKLDDKINKNIQLHKEQAVQRTQILKAGNLKSYIKKFGENIANVKMGIKKKITKDLKFQEDDKFKPYKEAIALAHATNNHVGVLEATKALQKALNESANTHPILKKYDEEVMPYVQFRKIAENIDNSGFMDKDITGDENIKQQLQYGIDYGLWALGHKTVSASIIDTATQIIKLLQNKIAG